MPEEWLTYREIGARLGLNVEAVRTRVRRAGWRTQPGNDGRTRVLVPDRVLVEPVEPDNEGVNDRVNRSGGMTGLVTLLAAAEARISRLEQQLVDERDRVNDARAEADRLRKEAAHLTTRADRAEQASTAAEVARQEAVQVAEELQRDLEAAKHDAQTARTDLASARHAADQARGETQEAQDAAEALREVEEARKARGRWARLRAAWRGE